MNTSKHFRLSTYFISTKPVTRLLAGILLSYVALFPSFSFAQGVAAGTEISNLAVVSYMIGTVNQDPIESSPNGNTLPGSGVATTFVVDRKIDLVVTGDNNTNVALGDLQSEVTFTLLNEGNDTQTFQLTPNGSITTDNFDTSSCTVLVTAVSGTPLAGVTLPTSGDIKLSPDQQASISVKCDIPLTNGGTPIATDDISLISLTAIAQTNGDGSATAESTTADNKQLVETLYVDNAGTDDIDRDASHSARRTYTVSTSSAPPTLTIEKSILEVKDPTGGNTAVTGSEVSYKINIDTQGVGTIDSVVISDITPAEMTYKPASMMLSGNNITDSDDSDKGDFGITSAKTATVDLGNITAGSQFEIQLTYIIN